MTDKKQTALRKRAELALKKGHISLPETIHPTQPEEVEKLIEEFRIYQAELELQNEELRQSQFDTQQALNHYSTLFRSLPLASIVLDRYGIIEEANEQALKLFSFTSHFKLLKHSFYRLISEIDRPALFQILRHHDSETVKTLAGLKVFKNYQEFSIMDAHLIQLPLAYHLDHYWVVLLIDRSIEMAREHDRLLFQSMLNNNPSIMSAFDEKGYCLLANTALFKSLNLPKEHILGQHRSFWLDINQTDIEQKRDYEIFITGNPVLEEEVLSVNHKQQHYLTNRFPLRNSAGDIFAIGQVKTDITVLREIELRLQLATQIFSQGSEGIMITDANNTIISVNKAFEKITGYQESEVLGKNPALLSSGQQSAHFYQQMWQDLLDKNEWEGELYNRRKNGEFYPQHLSINRVLDTKQHLIYYIAIFNDITRKKQIEQEIHRLAFYDALTATPNRHLLQDRVTQTIIQARQQQSRFALLFLDLDHFKEINDTLGHTIGDSLLIEVTQRLRHQINPQDTLSRFGGDEFILLITQLNQLDMIAKANMILATISEPYCVQDKSLHISVSIGIAIYPEDGNDYPSLLKNADTAMYQAKANGRNNFRFFTHQMENLVLRRMAIESALHDAIQFDQFSLVYQPQISLITEELVGVEVLLRWKNAELANPTPDEFIPIAESNGLIVKIDHWVLTNALQQMKVWLDSGLKPFTIAVNISSRQFWDQNFAEFIQQALVKAEIPGHLLELELTERLVMHQPEFVIKIMQKLKSLGVKISIDDFGTGYSSLSYLKRLPINKLKIDQSFIRDIHNENDDEIIVLSIIQLAKALHKEVIAEGVETIEQKLFLANANCDTAQGYLYAEPMLAEEFNNWLNYRTLYLNVSESNR